jgi:hypothetical protein
MQEVQNYETFFDALTEFAPPAIAKLKQMYGKPRFGYPRYALRGWRRGIRDPEDFYEKKIGPVWLEQHGTLAWKRSGEIAQLPEFRRLLDLVESDETLRRRLFAAFGAVIYNFEDTSSYVYHVVQYKILEPLVLAARGFQCSEDQILDLCRGLERKISSISVTSKSTVVLGSFWIENDMRLDDETIVRRMSDDELSDAIEFGIVARRHVARGGIYVPESDQFAACYERVTRLKDDDFLRPDFQDVLKRATSNRIPAELIRQFLTAVNLYDTQGAAGIKGGVRATRLELIDSRSHLQIDSPVPSPGATSVELYDSDLQDFARFFDQISGKRVRERLAVPLDRFTRSRSRESDDEAIVDLAIAAESLFGGDGSGEATHRVSLNAALFLGNGTWLPSDVRRFFREVYSRRSSIVHGVNRRSTNPEMSNEMIRRTLESAMRDGIHKAARMLSGNPDELDWGKILDSRLNNSIEVDDQAGDSSTLNLLDRLRDSRPSV